MIQSDTFNITGGDIVVPLDPPVPMDIQTRQLRMVAQAIITEPEIVVLIGFGPPAR